MEQIYNCIKSPALPVLYSELLFYIEAQIQGGF